jgi:hypothetical protein
MFSSEVTFFYGLVVCGFLKESANININNVSAIKSSLKI